MLVFLCVGEGKGLTGILASELWEGVTTVPQAPEAPRRSLRWLYCLTIIGCNFVLNDLLHQTLISYNGPWFTFSFMHI